jgi:predicted nucleic acid-binding protein
MIFCDTSFAAKFYAFDAETAGVRQRLSTEPKVFVSELFRVELMAVFHRRRREKFWSKSDFSAAVSQFHSDDANGDWAWLPCAGDVLVEAGRIFERLPETIFLRAADCIHLATALHHGFAEFYTFDRHQAQAAQALGLRVFGL